MSSGLMLADLASCEPPHAASDPALATARAITTLRNPIDNARRITGPVCMARHSIKERREMWRLTKARGFRLRSPSAIVEHVYPHPNPSPERRGAKRSAISPLSQRDPAGEGPGVRDRARGVAQSHSLITD